MENGQKRITIPCPISCTGWVYVKDTWNLHLRPMSDCDPDAYCLSSNSLQSTPQTVTSQL